MESHELAPLILIVEDNLTNARLTGGMLEAVGFRVAFATDGDEGFRAARELGPALVVTDLQMPRLDGLSLLRRLKDDPLTEKIAVLVLTAHVLQEHRDRAFEAGCCAFVAKPVRFQPFVAEVRRVLCDSPSGACCES